MELFNEVYEEFRDLKRKHIRPTEIKVNHDLFFSMLAEYNKLAGVQVENVEHGPLLTLFGVKVVPDDTVDTYEILK